MRAELSVNQREGMAPRALIVCFVKVDLAGLADVRSEEV